MAYSTAQDMIDAFGHAEMRDLSDTGETRTGDVVTAVLNKAIADAGAMIDGYLLGRYQLPLDPAPGALSVHCRGMARYFLMTNSPDDRAKADFAGALKYLQAVASGSISLLPPSSAGQVAAGMGPVVFDTGSKVFGRESD
jgi:phage gp36-like protein